MIKIITSPTNPAIKHVQLLSEKARARKSEGLFVVEGRREIRLALESGYNLYTLFFNPKVVSFTQLLDEFGEGILSLPLNEVNHAVYEKLAYRESTEGVIAVLKSAGHALEELVLPDKNPFLLVVQAPEKPGNLGAIFRTADAAGVDAVIVADPHTDLYNPNIVRSSVGGLFTNQIALGSSEEVLLFLKSRGIKVCAAVLSSDSVSCFETDFTGPLAIAVGTESTGLTERWQQAADEKVTIPMSGKLDSMNMSVSAGILLFEAVRQRRIL